jgi:hypothetical protein
MRHTRGRRGLTTSAGRFSNTKTQEVFERLRARARREVEAVKTATTQEEDAKVMACMVPLVETAAKDIEVELSIEAMVGEGGTCEPAF